jgi:fluoride exporter
MNFLAVAGVAAGGAIGSVARYLIAGWVQSPAWNGFPYAILIVNITGSFVMGLITGALALKFHVTPETRAFLTTGIVGGYTTFSTFSLESAMLVERHAYGQTALYIAGSVVLSILALFAGLWLMRVLYA